MAAPTEFELQRAFVMWYCGKRYPKNHERAGEWKIVPAKLPGVVSWYTPQNSKRDNIDEAAREGSWNKDMGLVAGIPDYFMLWGRLHALEFKKPGGLQPPERNLSTVQKNLHPRLVAAGAFVATVDNLADAKAQAVAWGLVC